jgi:hypothetical protein
VTPGEAAAVAGVSRTRIQYLVRRHGYSPEGAARHVLQHRSGERVLPTGRPPEVRDVLLALVRDRPGLTAGEIGEAIGRTYDQAHKLLLRTLHRREVRRSGRGVRGDAHRYWIKGESEPTDGGAT